MTDKSQQLYQQLCQFTRQTASLTAMENALAWDERTMLPLQAGEYRTEQLTLLAGILHERRTDPRLGEWLAELSSGPPAPTPTATTAPRFAT